MSQVQLLLNRYQISITALDVATTSWPHKLKCDTMWAVFMLWLALATTLLRSLTYLLPQPQPQGSSVRSVVGG